MIQFDVHIFQMGWFNHQLEMVGPNQLGDESLLADFFGLKLQSPVPNSAICLGSTPLSR